MRFSCLALIVASLAAPTLAAASLACRFEDAATEGVVRVVDARTLSLRSGAAVQLAGVETFAALLSDPARADRTAAEALTRHLAKRQHAVHRLSGARDRHGRLPAVILADGVPLQESLVREGLALVMPQAEAPSDCAASWLAVEADARRRGAGFWRDPEAAVRPAEAAALAGLAGRFVIVEGRVETVGTRRTRSYLNFGTKWSEDVTGEIDADDRDMFGGVAGIEALARRRVRIRGFVEDRGGPAIRLRFPGQVEALDRMSER